MLRQLTEATPRWAVWKGADALPERGGDIDSIAPRRDWAAIERTFVAWARLSDLDSVVTCTHPPGMLILAGVVRASPGRLVQLDVVARKQRHGATLFEAGDLQALLELDERGFRRLRRGAEATLRLSLDSSDAGARALLALDPKGAQAAGAVIGPLGTAAVAAPSVASRTRLEIRAVLQSLTHPRPLAEGLIYDVRWRLRCPVLQALRADRRIPGDVEQWLSHVARTHSVHALR